MVAVGKYFEMTSEIRDYFDGLIIGDGHYQVEHKSKLSVSYTFGQRIDHKGWADAQMLYFDEHGIDYHLSYKDPHTFFNKQQGKFYTGAPTVHLATKKYRTLLPERLRWYPEGKKIIPKDLNITSPQMLANWAMGDGNCYITKYNKIEFKLYTLGFLIEDVEWVKEEFINKLNIKPFITLKDQKYPILHFYNKESLKLIEIIKPFVVDCFKYKVPEDPRIDPICVMCSLPIIDGHLNKTRCDNCDVIHERERSKLKQRRVRAAKKLLIV